MRGEIRSGSAPLHVSFDRAVEVVCKVGCVQRVRACVWARSEEGEGQVGQHDRAHAKYYLYNRTDHVCVRSTRR